MRPDSFTERLCYILIAAILAVAALWLADSRFDEALRTATEIGVSR